MVPESLPGESITGTHDGLLRLYLKRDSGSLHRVHGNGPSFRILHLRQSSLSYSRALSVSIS